MKKNHLLPAVLALLLVGTILSGVALSSPWWGFKYDMSVEMSYYGFSYDEDYSVKGEFYFDELRVDYRGDNEKSTTTMSYENDELKDSMPSTIKVFKTTAIFAWLGFGFSLAAFFACLLYVLSAQGLEDPLKRISSRFGSGHLAAAFAVIALVFLITAPAYFASELPEALSDDDAGIYSFKGEESEKDTYYSYERTWGPMKGYSLDIAAACLVFACFAAAGVAAYLSVAMGASAAAGIPADGLAQNGAVIVQSAAKPFALDATAEKKAQKAARTAPAAAGGGERAAHVKVSKKESRRETGGAVGPGRRRDVVVAGIAAAAVVIIALSLVLAYFYGDFGMVGSSEEIGAQGSDYLITWQSVQKPAGSSSWYSEESESREVEFKIDDYNVRDVTFNLTWEDDETDLTDYDSFSLVVYDPKGAQVASGSSSDGKITMRIDVYSLPPAMTVNADSEAGAINETNRIFPPNSLGKGTWRAVVKLDDTGSPLNQLPVSSPLPLDEGNSWKLEAAYRVNEPMAKKLE
ncbi:MAG: hypothetical protein CVT48_00040 [Thermoplasmata archaeon HGW-Thermoplasmata-1]|nr:MAG: hypothetical protein CVT48_00040 [Thermoplasmata archaeon HGW-Thermoplasmata-1]